MSGVVFARDAQIVGGGERLFAQIVEGKARHAHKGARHMHAAPLQRQVLRRALMAAGEPPPGVVERRIRRRIGRHIPDRQAGELFQPEVGARFEPHDIHALFEHVDERHEQSAIQAVLVEIVRRHVRRRHHDDAALEQCA